jgi:hypothetical protein
LVIAAFRRVLMSLMNLSEIMDRSIDVLRKHVKSIALFTIGYGIVAFIAVFLFIIIGGISIGILSAFLESPVIAIVFLSLVGVLAAAFTVSIYSGTIKIASQEFLVGEVFAHDAIKASFKNIFKVFGIIFCGVVMFIPAGALIGAIGYFMYKRIDMSIILVGTMSARVIIIIALTLIYMLFSIFIFLLYTTWFSFSLHALVLEGKGVFGAIKRSFILVRKNYWRTFGATLLFTLTVYFIRISIDSLLALGSSIIFFISKLLNISQDYMTFMSSVYSYLSWPVNLIFWMIITPLGAIMLTMLYFNQRFNKEGFDMLLRLEEIQKNEERKQISEAIEFNNSH